MRLAGPIYGLHGFHEPAKTNRGLSLYNGTAAGFEVWAYRFNVKLGALNAANDTDEKRQKLIEYGAHVIEGLSDNALLVAMDFGQDKFNMPDGVKALVEIMPSTISRVEGRQDLGVVPYGCIDLRTCPPTMW